MNKKSKTKIELAWEFYQKDDGEKASKLCKPILNVKKYALSANYLLGLIAYDRRDFENALQYFTFSLTLDVNKKAGGFINYWIGRTCEYSESWMDDDNPVYNKEKAIEAYNEAKKYDNYPYDLFFKVITPEKSDFEKIRLYKEAIEKFPSEIDSYIYLSKLHKRLGYPLNQLEVLNLAKSNGIKSSSLMFNLGNYYFEQRDYATGLKYFKECSELNNNSKALSTIYYCIGDCLLKLKKIEESIPNFIKSFELEKNDPGIWYGIMGLILCYSKQKKKEKIIKLITEIPSGRNLFEYLSLDYSLMTYFDSRMMEEISFDHVNEIIPIILKFRNGSKDTIFIFKTGLLLAELYNHNNEYSNKLKILHSCIPYPLGYDFVENKLIETYYLLTSSDTFSIEVCNLFLQDIQRNYLKDDTIEIIAKDLVNKVFNAKRYGEVVLICENLKEKQVESTKLLFEYAFSLKVENRPKESKLYYEKYLEMNPKSSAALNNLGVIYKENGDYERAASLYKEAIKHDGGEELYENNLKATLKLIEKKKQEQKQMMIPESWSSSIKNININRLEAIEYFDILNRIDKINKKYRSLVGRDFKELVFNYLVNNLKSTVAISGSLVEMILTYYCEKKKLLTIQITDSQGNIQKKKLYDCVLNDLIIFVESKKLFGNDFHHLGNLSRIYRNFIHPGLELKNKVDIKPKADLCFISSLEILKKIIN